MKALIKAAFDYKSMVIAIVLAVTLIVCYVAFDNIQSRNEANRRADLSQQAAIRAQDASESALARSQENSEILAELVTTTELKDRQIAALVAENQSLRDQIAALREEVVGLRRNSGQSISSLQPSRTVSSGEQTEGGQTESMTSSPPPVIARSSPSITRPRPDQPSPTHLVCVPLSPLPDLCVGG